MTTPNICQTCGLRKQSFATRREARAIAKAERTRHLRVYPCGPYWHLTSAPADLAAILRDRDATR